LKTGSGGDSPAPVGDPPTGTAESTLGKGRLLWLGPLLPFRPAGRQTTQAGRLCYPKTIFQKRSKRREKRSLEVA